LENDETFRMSSQASVHSIDSLKDLRVALALYGEETLEALGGVEAEVRRTLRWLQDERPFYWQEQIKRRREQVSQARAEVFKKNLQKRPDYVPPMSEQKENLRKAEISLQEAEKRLAMVRKWQPLFKQAVLEYHASVQRLKDLAAGDVPRAVNVLTRMIDALESYLRVAPPSGRSPETAAAPGMAATLASAEFVSLATKVLDEAEAATTAQAELKEGAKPPTQDSDGDDSPGSAGSAEPHASDPAAAGLRPRAE
jgi:hypothetical protein